MTLVGDGVWQSIYTIPLLVGPTDAPTTFPVQLDTGSADLWFASSACSTSSCSSLPSNDLFNPTSTSVATDKPFNISYAAGSVSGPIYWDTVQVGGYSMSNQAFSAADEVKNEDLTSGWLGVAGFALPHDSLIAQTIGTTTSNSPDGATLSSNLFGIAPKDQAPARRFFGILLERPGIPQDNSFIPSVLSIGTHPTSLLSMLPSVFPTTYGQASSSNLTAVSQNSNITAAIDGILPTYTTTVLPMPDGNYQYWRTQLTLLTIYPSSSSGGVPVSLGGGKGNSIYPVVIFDTGGSTILTSRNVANALYGSISISPSADGNYYVPCTTPLNMTFTFQNLPPIPLHPLDLSASAPNNPSGMCLGIIQANSELDASSAPADIVLGVPFLRNVYTVIRYDALPSYTHNIFPSPSSSAQNANSIIPSLSLLPLTNITTALSQFHTVRVLSQPLAPAASSAPTSGQGTNTVKVGHKLSLGIVVLLGVIAALVVGGVGLCGGWFWVGRRRMRGRGSPGSRTRRGLFVFGAPKAARGNVNGEYEMADPTPAMGGGKTKSIVSSTRASGTESSIQTLVAGSSSSTNGLERKISPSPDLSLGLSKTHSGTYPFDRQSTGTPTPTTEFGERHERGRAYRSATTPGTPGTRPRRDRTESRSAMSTSGWSGWSGVWKPEEQPEPWEVAAGDNGDLERQPDDEDYFGRYEQRGEEEGQGDGRVGRAGSDHGEGGDLAEFGVRNASVDEGYREGRGSGDDEDGLPRGALHLRTASDVEMVNAAGSSSGAPLLGHHPPDSTTYPSVSPTQNPIPESSPLLSFPTHPTHSHSHGFSMDQGRMRRGSGTMPLLLASSRDDRYPSMSLPLSSSHSAYSHQPHQPPTHSQTLPYSPPTPGWTHSQGDDRYPTMSHFPPTHKSSVPSPLVGSPLNEELDLVRYPPLVGRSLGGRIRSGSIGGRSVSSPMPFTGSTSHHGDGAGHTLGTGVVDSPVEENPASRGLGVAF
ncbi:acid protease [Sistotremastrum niveocremeum HHB9708]|uniref:Acid protease n=1 Tax=Sistotremastrum niveocremeum HHB9708 TaxID=1314777 RepID=A0A164Q006_9AGAM|nr:acid protease [Sistotremastrum niveocremeum HHB9708]